MTASVPLVAPATPPLTGESTSVMPRSESPRATIVAIPGPDVERSTTVLTFEPRQMP